MDHWYNGFGETCYGAKLKEAREFQYLPSITSVDKMIANYGLQEYFQRQVFEASLTLTRDANESDDEFYKRVKIDSKEHARKAARLGNIVHKLVDRYISGKALFFRGQREDVWAIFNTVKQWIDENLEEPKSTIEYEEGAEVILVNEDIGYAGKADFVGKRKVTEKGLIKNVIIDFKTTFVKQTDVKKDGTLRKAKLYDSWCRQLTALDMCTKGVNLLQSVVISTDLNNLGVWVHTWDSKSIGHAWDEFTGALKIFRSIKKLCLKS